MWYNPYRHAEIKYEKHELDGGGDDGRRSARGSWPVVAILVFAIVSLFSIPLILTTPQIGDERYHYPLAVLFSSGFPIFDPNYSSAYTPLPYAIIGAVIHFLGPSLFVARFVNLGVGLFGMWGFYRIVGMLQPRASVWALAFLAFSPYYLRDCSALYMGNWAVAASIWGLLFYLRRARRSDTLRAGLFLGAGTLCGQWVLLVVAGAILAESAAAFESSWRTTRGALGEATLRVGVLVLFQVPAALVFSGWGGLAAPRFSDAHGLVLSPGHAVGVLAVIGFTFFWWAAARVSRVRPLEIATLVVFVPILFLGLPEVSEYQGVARFTGLSARILQGAGARLGFDAPLLLIPTALVGLLVVRLATRESDTRRATLSLGILLCIVAFAGSSIVGESHIRLLPILVFLSIVYSEPMGRPMQAVILQSSILGIVYTLYHAVVKFS